MAVILKNSADHLEIPIITAGSSLKTDWKPRILFANTVDISSGLIYGLDASYADASVFKWNTLSFKDSNTIDGSANSLLFEAAYTYCDQIWECNNTLYNKYYKEDIEWNLNNSAYLLTGLFLLNADDIQNLNFKNTVFIDHKIIGGSFYKINSIKNYKANQLTEVELIKVNSRVPGYDSSIAATQVYYTYSQDAGATTSSGGSGGTGGGGTGVSNLSELGDVLITSPVEGDYLEYDADIARWKNIAGVNKAYVDTSLGLRDTSINTLRSWNINQDTSISALDSSKADKITLFSYKDVSYNVATSDLNNIIEASGTLHIIFPNTISVGFSTTVINIGGGIITLNASTLMAYDSSILLRDKYAAANVICKDTGKFYAIGNLK